MRSTNSACYGCARRTATCHATCTDGKAEESQNAAKREAVRARSAGFYGKHDSCRVNLAIRERSRKDHWNY